MESQLNLNSASASINIVSVEHLPNFNDDGRDSLANTTSSNANAPEILVRVETESRNRRKMLFY